MAKSAFRLRSADPGWTSSHERLYGDDPAVRLDARLGGARAVYADEETTPWEMYFGRELAPLLPRGGRALDLGASNGGRTLVWLERYGFKEIVGIDIDAEGIATATALARERGANVRFAVSQGETLPFEDGSFDAILSFDVFEHVRDVARVLGECARVLRPDGKLAVVFPRYFHPIEHHLGHVTSVPGLQYVFSGKTLVRAYAEVVESRGEHASWYARSPDLEPWEACNTINGMTARRFRRLIQEGPWKVVLAGQRPIGSVGRRVGPASRAIAKAFAPLARAPLLEEVFLHRIAYVLER